MQREAKSGSLSHRAKQVERLEKRYPAGGKFYCQNLTRRKREIQGVVDPRHTKKLEKLGSIFLEYWDKRGR